MGPVRWLPAALLLLAAGCAQPGLFAAAPAPRAFPDASSSFWVLGLSGVVVQTDPPPATVGALMSCSQVLSNAGIDPQAERLWLPADATGFAPGRTWLVVWDDARDSSGGCSRPPLLLPLSRGEETYVWRHYGHEEPLALQPGGRGVLAEGRLLLAGQGIARTVTFTTPDADHRTFAADLRITNLGEWEFSDVQRFASAHERGNALWVFGATSHLPAPLAS